MTMTMEEAVKVLADHNEWRRGNDDFPATNPTKLGLALDVAIAALSAQEPVAWCRDGFIYDDRGCPIGTDETSVRWQVESPGDDWRPLYAARQRRSPHLTTGRDAQGEWDD